MMEALAMNFAVRVLQRHWGADHQWRCNLMEGVDRSTNGVGKARA